MKHLSFGRRWFLVLLGAVTLVSSAACGSSGSALIRSVRNPSMTAPLDGGLGVAVFEGAIESGLAEEIGRAISSALVERGLRSSFRVIPSDPSLRAQPILELLREHRALSGVGEADARENGAAFRFKLGVTQYSYTPTPEEPDAMTSLDVWRAEAEPPVVSTPDLVPAAVARMIVDQLVLDEIIR